MYSTGRQLPWHWLDASVPEAQILLMQLDLELATAVTACRTMAYQKGERAKKMQNLTTRGQRRGPAELL